MEAAGIEPASEGVSSQASTRVASVLFVSGAAPDAGSAFAYPTFNFSNESAGLSITQPTSMSAASVPMGDHEPRRSYLVKLRMPNCRWRLLFSRFFYEHPGVSSARHLRPIHLRRNQVAPGFVSITTLTIITKNPSPSSSYKICLT